MITVQLFIPAHNVPGSAYGAYLSTILKQWVSGFNEKGKDGKEAFKKKQYVIDEINSLESGMTSDMGKSGPWTPVYSLAYVDGLGIGAYCKRGNASTAQKHKIELIISLPEVLRPSWPKPSPTSILVAEAARVAQVANAVLKLDTESDDLVGLYRDAYGFVVSGAKFGEKTPMTLSLVGITNLLNKYQYGRDWTYDTPLPAPPG